MKIGELVKFADQTINFMYGRDVVSIIVLNLSTLEASPWNANRVECLIAFGDGEVIKEWFMPSDLISLETGEVLKFDEEYAALLKIKMDKVEIELLKALEDI